VERGPRDRQAPAHGKQRADTADHRYGGRFSGLFGTPSRRVFFALEVLTVCLSSTSHSPAFVASFAASLTSSRLGLEHFSFPVTDSISLSWPFVLKLLAAGVLFGVTGGLFSASLHKMKELLAGRLKNPVFRIFIIGIAISAFSLLCWGGRYPASDKPDRGQLSGEVLLVFCEKLVFTVVTGAAGFQGGESRRCSRTEALSAPLAAA
jgi:H+/Cl- antiporter ClcA